MKLNFGCDPEVFSTIKVDNKELVISPALLEKFSGLKYLKSDPLHKHPIFIQTEKFNWMMDGCAFELTLRQPYNDPLIMYNTIQESLNVLEEFLSYFTYKGEKLNLYKLPVVEINPEEYIEHLEDETVYQGFIFGCDPDRDAFNLGYKCETIDVFTHLFRYGGGHIHISGDEILFEEILPAIKLLAITVGNYVITKSPTPELEKKRGETYGKPGRYRPQKYPSGEKGLEYRSPSNSWLNFSYSDFEKIFEWAEKAHYFLSHPKLGYELIENFQRDTINAIISADKNLANKILEEIK